MIKFFQTLRDNSGSFLMVLPGALWLILFFYIPVFGNVVAFKDYHMIPVMVSDLVINIIYGSDSIIRFLFIFQETFIITRNTLSYTILALSLEV